MANESNKELTSVWTPANIVTCVRIVFIPVFMIVSALSHASVAGTDWSTFDLSLIHISEPTRPY